LIHHNVKLAMNQNLRPRDLIHQIPPLPAREGRLHDAAINADVILEPSVPDPRQPHLPDEGLPPRRAGVWPPGPTFRRQVSPPGQGLRLLPVSGFFWGGPLHGRAGPGLTQPKPRVRGDHVILFIRQGGIVVEFPRRRHLLSDGQLAFVPLGTAFALRPPQDVEGWALLVPAAFTELLPVALPAEFRAGAPDASDQAMIGPAFRALGRGEPMTQIQQGTVACHLGLLAAALSRLDDRAAPPGRPDRPEVDARPLTEEFLALAAANLAENRTVSEMARDLHSNLAGLDAACRQSRGRSALELVYALRLERAADLLRNGSKSIPQIARELGYTGPGHFMRAFAAATGRTPQAFRTSVHEPVTEGD